MLPDFYETYDRLAKERRDNYQEITDIMCKAVKTFNDEVKLPNVAVSDHSFIVDWEGANVSCISRVDAVIKGALDTLKNEKGEGKPLTNLLVSVFEFKSDDNFKGNLAFVLMMFRLLSTVRMVMEFRDTMDGERKTVLKGELIKRKLLPKGKVK